MTELTLHFEATQGTDLDAAAAELQQALAKQKSVQSASATPQRFQAIGPTEILAVVGIATTAVQGTKLLLKEIAELIDAWREVRSRFPGVKSPTVEVGLRKVPLDQVTAENIEKINSDE